MKGEIEKVSSVNQESGNVVIWGDVFSAECRTVKDGTLNIFTFYVTDYTGSIAVKVLVDVKKVNHLMT